MITELSQMIDIIIAGYYFIAAMWFVMGCVHINWGTKNSFAGILFSVIWLFQAYRTYTFYTTPGNVIDEKGVWYNVLFVLAVSVASLLMAWAYFPNVVRWSIRMYNRIVKK